MERPDYSVPQGYVFVTAENLEKYRKSHGDWVKIGHTLPDPIPQEFDMRIFGQLRTWLGDPPKKGDHL